MVIGHISDPNILTVDGIYKRLHHADSHLVRVITLHGTAAVHRKDHIQTFSVIPEFLCVDRN